MNVHDIKTIDDLVDYFIREYRYITKEMDCVGYRELINMFGPKIINILKSENNSPSKHDLMILKEIRSFNNYTYTSKEHREILNLYKDRK